MSDVYILYNSRAGHGEGKKKAKALAACQEERPELVDMTKVKDYGRLITGLNAKDKVILCGGDGTLNYFVNAINGKYIPCKLYYYPCGTGNDFLRDIGVTEEECPVQINRYLENLPTVRIKGKTHRFLNGVGYGIDGYCCEEGDRQKAKGKKKVNYTNIAIIGLLFKYKPTNVTVEVDGKSYRFERVWLAPTMFGRYYGGGMMATPDQDRNGKDKKVSLLLFHGSGKLKTLCIFPSIFKGEHIKKKKYTTVLTGKHIRVRYDESRPAQIDGDTVKNVKEYEVFA